MVHFFCNSSELENQYIKKSQVEPFLSHHFQLYLCVIWWWECVWYDLNVCDMMRMCDMMMRMCVIWLLRMYVIWWTGCGGSIILSLNHKGRVRLYASVNQGNIGSDYGLSPVRRQAIIWNNGGLLLIGSLGTNFSEIQNKTLFFIQKH